MKIPKPSLADRVRRYVRRIVQPASAVYSTMPAFLMKIPFMRPATPVPGITEWDRPQMFFKWRLPNLGPLSVVMHTLAVIVVAIIVAKAAPSMMESAVMDGGTLDRAIQGLSAAVVYGIAALMGAAAVLPTFVIPGYGVEAAQALAPFEPTDAQVIVSILGQAGAVCLAVGALWMYAWPFFAPLVGASAAVPERESLTPSQDALARSFGRWVFAAACATAVLCILATVGGGMVLKGVALTAMGAFGGLACLSLVRLVADLRTAGLGPTKALWVGFNYAFFGVYCGAAVAAMFVAAAMMIVIAIALVIAWTARNAAPAALNEAEGVRL